VESTPQNRPSGASSTSPETISPPGVVVEEGADSLEFTGQRRKTTGTSVSTSPENGQSPPKKGEGGYINIETDEER
jgi:hypothetical protein